MQTHLTPHRARQMSATSTIVANTSPSLATGLSWVHTGTCCGPAGIAETPPSCCPRTSRRI